MTRENPWMKFYPHDWRGDVNLRRCSFAARGLWVDLLSIMHEAEPYGHLVIDGQKASNADLCRVLGTHHKTLIALLKELGKNGVYSVSIGGIIYSRRMVRDHAKSLQDKENGKRGGNPRVMSGVNPPVKAEDKAQKPEARSQKSTLSNESVARTRKRVASEATMPEALTPSMLAHAAESGFVNGNADRLFAAWRDYHIGRGTPIASVEASFRSWVRNEINFKRGNGYGANRQASTRVLDGDIFSGLATEFEKRGA